MPSRPQRSKKKRRTISITFTAAKSINGFRINRDTGLFEPMMDGVPLENGLKNVSTSVSYARERKPKVVTKIPQTTGQVQMTPYSFLEHFDVVFAVDTNTRRIGADIHSVAAMAILEVRNIIRKANGNLAKVDLNINMFGGLIRGKNIPGNPEGWVWRIAIEEAIKKLYPKYSDVLRIGLTVDSNLSSLDRYNSRELPIHGDYFLPKNVTLIYASADSGSDYVLNKLIKICDREAELQLDSFERGVLSDEVFTKLNEHKEIKVPGTAFRFYGE